FVGANFLLQRMLNRYHDDLGVAALPQELVRAADDTQRYLESRAARLSLEHVEVRTGQREGPRLLQADVIVENLGGDKLPPAYPSGRGWIHCVGGDSQHRIVFESGALNADAPITGNDNDADATKFEPHHREIHSRDDVQIYEPILGDSEGRVTTGL